MLEEYSEAASSQGALLFAVARETLSEGINFTDGLERYRRMPYPYKGDRVIGAHGTYIQAANLLYRQNTL